MQIEQERYARDMNCEQCTEMLIPEHSPSSKYFETATLYKTALYVGGDYFDFIRMMKSGWFFLHCRHIRKGCISSYSMANFRLSGKA
jgi:hypothetical protein